MYDALVAIEAPPNLIAWASSEEREQHADAELVRLNHDPVWAIWLYAAQGIPLRALVEAAALEASAAVEELSEAQEPLREALRVTRALLEGRAEASEAITAAERAEAIAENPVGSYRSFSTQPVITPVATACAYLARASEALASAELSLSTQRLVNAQYSAALLGMGTSGMVGGGSRALCLNPAAIGRDPVQQLALYVPAAVAEAVRELLVAQERRLAAADLSAIGAAMSARFDELLAPLVYA